MTRVNRAGVRYEDVELRDAATILLVRDGDDGVEVLMLRRNAALEFSPGAYVFPGGAVDDADRDPGAWDVLDGLDDAEASRHLGLEAGGLAYWLAALRESFEEAGLLIGRNVDGSPVAHRDADEVIRQRRAVEAESPTMAELCRDQGWRLDAAAVTYFSHWITPVGEPRRYDTRFFMAPAPEGQDAVHDDNEAVEQVWTTARTALARHEQGEIVLIFPTLRTLQSIARFDTAAELLAAARAVDQVPTNAPTMIVEPDRIRFELDGDPGHVVPRRRRSR